MSLRVQSTPQAAVSEPFIIHGSFDPEMGPMIVTPAKVSVARAPVCRPDESALACTGSLLGAAGAGIRDAMLDFWGRMVGVAGLLGLRYAVTPYQAKVSEALWRGSRVDEADIAALAAKGFRGIVDLRRESNSDAESARIFGLAALRVPILDNDHPSIEQVKDFLAFVAKPEHQPVYVHCQAGKGRTGVMVAAYRMAVLGWTLEQALAEAESRGLKMPNQKAFLRELAGAIAAGDFDGFARAERTRSAAA